MKETFVPGKFQRVFPPIHVKGKLFWSYLSSRPWRHAWKWRYTSTHSQRRH